MSHNIFAKFLALTFVTILTGACASGPKTSINRIDRSAEIPNAPYSRVLVVGVARNRDNGRRFETALATELTNENASATANYLENPDGVVTDAMVREVVSRKQADAVIVTSIKRIDVDTEVDAERIEVERSRRNDNLVDFFRYDYKDITTPATVALTYNVVLTTEVFDSDTGKKVYSLESSTLKAETTFEIILAESAAIAKQLRKDGIVR